MVGLDASVAAAWAMAPELGIALLLLGGFVLFVCAYFVPAAAAGFRSHPRPWLVFLVNLLLGWTFVGWFVALAWAFKRYPQTTSVSSYFESIARANRLANKRSLARPGLNRPSRETVITILGLVALVIASFVVLLVVAKAVILSVFSGL